VSQGTSQQAELSEEKKEPLKNELFHALIVAAAKQ
jgi:hypothetical protein